ncbi:MAG TPA: molecular chaperone DnaK [Verrucomicrobiales bacterium]|nr:molecular chaperone DnaK [Verrucomicrobiales bacterium]
MGKIIGIDLGTTNSLVAVVDSGIPLVLADDQGRRLTPSVVRVPASGEPIVGWEAKRARAAHPETTITSIKRFMGRRASDLDSTEDALGYPVRAEGNAPVTVPLQGREWTPAEVSAEILKVLKTLAGEGMIEPPEAAVITVPAYFNDAQRNATRKAGELAGLRVERIINEPTAAALAYGLNSLKEKSKIAVYDLGGGTFDLSILELNKGVFQVLATCGNTRLGGDDIDRALARFLSEQLGQAGGPEVTKDAGIAARLGEAAEEAKIRLSTETETTIALPFLTPEFSFEFALSLEQLERLAKPVVARTREYCLKALADAGLGSDELDQVILVGGQTRMPLVREFASEVFGCGDGKPELNTKQNPDEAVALGAAIQGGILSGDFSDLLLLDVTPLSLGIETFGGLMNVIIPRNTTIPVKRGEAFTTVADYQKEVLIHVLQGEREKAADNWSLGRFTLEFEPQPKGMAKMGVQFEIDADGILHVLARDIKTGNEKIVEMRSAVDVDDDDVQQMIEESVDHAFDDIEERRWVEAKLRAEQTTEATSKGLKAYGNELPEEQITKIETALADVVALLAAKEKGGPVTAASLKDSNARLDAATQPLAELMMDRVMEQMLEKRGVLPG